MRRAAVVLFFASTCACGKSPIQSADVDREVPAPSPLLPRWFANAVPEGANACDGVRLEIRAVQREGYTMFQGTLTHAGTDPVTLVTPGDGSEVGWRTPIVTWDVRTLDGKKVELEQGRCGNMNAIHDDEIFALRPGEKRALGDWLGAPPVPPGEYVVRVVYENDPSHDTGTADIAPETRAKIRQSTACRIASPSIKVRITQ